MGPVVVPLQAGGIAFGLVFVLMLLFQLLFYLVIYVGLSLVGIFVYDKFLAPSNVDAARVAELERDVAELRLALQRQD